MTKCSRCKKEKLLNADNFYKSKANRSGFSGVCKVCTKEYQKNYQERLLKENPNYHKEQYEKNKKYFQGYCKEYYKENKDVIAERAREYYHENKDKVKEYILENKCKIRYYNRKWSIDNEEYLIKYRRKYHSDNKERINERARIRQKMHPEKSRINRQKYRARLKMLPYTFTEQEWIAAKKHFGNTCCYCGSAESLEQDHFIALTKGGGYTKENIVPACLICNSSKNNKDFFEWYPTTEFYDANREEKILTYLKFDRYKNRQLTLV